MNIAADPGQVRSDAARRLISQTATESVELVTVSALELCVLGGPGQVLFDEPVTRAWAALAEPARVAALQAGAQSLANRDLLFGQESAAPGFDTYTMAPELGLVLAARTRPTFAILAQIERVDARPIKMFAVGDEEQPLQALAVEFPQELPPGLRYRHARAMGPLGWLYRYILAAPRTGANLLGAWAILPPSKSTRQHRDPVRTISVYRHRTGEGLQAQVVTVRGDGRTARLIHADDTGTGIEYDRAGLQEVLYELVIAGQS